LGLSWIVANQFSTVQSAGRLAKSLNRMLLIYSAILLVVYIIAPEATGLHRTSRLHSADGLVHPTAAGATASLGLILASGLYILRIESRAWMVIGCFIQAAILLIARSRASILCATIVLPILVTTLAGRHWLGRILLGTAFCLSALLIVDPGFQSVENLTEAAFSFIRRGQTTQQLASGSGRFELWVAIVDEFKHSPIIGHGYFVTSRTGEINAWDGPSNRDAHNVALQVLATMGVVGMSLLFWALWRWLILLFSIAIHGAAASGLGKLVLLVCLWYGIWGLGCTTFLGPVRPESVVFFCLVGMTIGLNRCLRNSASSHGRRVAT
jgi:O-antigen ligase